jgi:hypothetical protein
MVIQLSPPLVAQRELLDRMVGIVGKALETASNALATR